MKKNQFILHITALFCFLAIPIVGYPNVVSAPEANTVQELTLEKAMDKAQATSETAKAIAVASQNVNINRANKNAQILSMLPNLSITGQYLKPIDGINALTSSSVSPDLALTTIGTAFTAGATITQPIIGLYSLVLQLGQNSALLRASIQNKNQTIQDERYLGAASFINCTKSFQLIKVADAAIEVAEKQLSDAQAHFNEGLLTNADVLKFKLDLDNAKTNRVYAEKNYQIALATLAMIIGEENSESIILPQEYKSVMENKKTALGNVDAIVAERVPLRYDILALQENLTAQGYAKKNAIASYLPSLNFVMIFARDFEAQPVYNPAGEKVFSKSDLQDSLFYGAQLSWNFWDWGVRQTQISAASASQQITHLQLLQARDNAKVDIKSTYNNLLAAYESLNLRKSSVEYSESVYQQRLEQFQNGLMSSTDLVIASNDQTLARANYVNAIGDLDLAWMDYYRSTRQHLTTLKH